MRKTPGRIIFLSILFCIATFTSFAQFDQLFKLPFPEQYEAFNEYIHAGVDSATDVSRAHMLLQHARQIGDERNKLNAERATLAIDEMWNVDSGHIEARGAALINRAERIDLHPITGFVYEVLGDYYYKKNNYIHAFEYYLRAYDHYHNLYSSEFPDMSEIQYYLALAYFRFQDYEKALKYSKQLTGSDLRHKAYLDIFIQDLIGMSYLKLGIYDSALIYFQKTKTKAPQHHNAEKGEAWKGIATGNIGMTWLRKGMTDMAIPFLADGVALTGLVPDNKAAFAVCLYNIYMAKGNKTEAKKYLLIAREATYRSHTIQAYTELYPALSAFYRAEGNAVLTLAYQDSAIKYKDSLATINDVGMKLTVELALAEERRNKTAKLNEEERARAILMRNGLIIIAVLLLLFTLLFYNRKLLKQKYDRQQLLSDKLVAETQLVSAKRLLDNYKQNIAEKNELISGLEKEISYNEDNTALTKLQQSTILTDEQWDNFRQLFEKVHPGFLQSLKEKLPGLSPSETRFMVLAKLEFTNKDMASALGVSSQAIRTTWYRLRKKLNLPEEGSLEELVQMI